MTRNEFRSILIEERDKFLAEMKREGFFCLPYEKRYDATAWDINNGLCDDFFCRILARVPDITEPKRTIFYEDLCHIVIKWRGYFYDAECVDGVRSLKQLPIYLNRGKSREEVLAERKTRSAQ